MKKISLSLAAIAATTMLNAATVAELEEKINDLEARLNKVQQHDAKDNIKFTVDFRNEINSINYKYNKYSFKGTKLDGKEYSNDNLLASRLFLNMKSSPVSGLTFTGQLAAYGVWGSHAYGVEDKSLKGWGVSSKPSDTMLRIRQAYFVYSKDNYAFSVGRRQATDGFLANHREGNENPGSPLAHITNMEVDAAMVKYNFDDYIPGSFLKVVGGRAHTGSGVETLYDNGGYRPYALDDKEDTKKNVDFLVLLGSLYNDGQYKVMAEYAHIFDTKGKNLKTDDKSAAAGTADLAAISFQMTGVGDMINDFLDETTLFASFAMTNYAPENGHQLLGSKDDEEGYSVWAGFTIPDMVTEGGKLGFEYNHGTKYWTPMTWAEDSIMGSKLAVRGDAYEAYWNFNILGLENLQGQVRYTYIQHDYTPNIRCSGWVKPQEVDIEAQNVRAFVRYQF